MSNEIILSEKQRQLVEQVGVLHEKGGLPPAPSRVLALLLVSPDPAVTFDQIVDTLKLSKSAASNATNLLINIGKIDYSTKTGDRKRYFKTKMANWREEIKLTFEKMQSAVKIFEEVLEQRPGTTVEFNKNLSDMIDFVHFLNAELPTIYMRWEKERR